MQAISLARQAVLDAASGTRRGHTLAARRIYWEDETYSDRRVLLYVPPGFDPKRQAAILMFLHGNKAQLMRDVRHAPANPPASGGL